MPVGKAYFGFTDEELEVLDRFVRNNTVARFGPVREVEKSLVLEVAFDSIHASSRHKSGLAMRFPRIHRVRWDKPVHEALSHREGQVFRMLAEGQTVGQIALSLNLSSNTVSTYRARVLEKTGVRNDVELALYAVRQQVVLA